MAAIYVSLFKNFYATPENADIFQIAGIIAGPFFEEKILQIRSLIGKGEFDAASELKKQLPSFTPSATFNRRRLKDCVATYSQIIHLDFDNLTKPQLDALVAAVAALPYTFLAFISPSGKGLKVFVRTNGTQDNHEASYKSVSDYYYKHTNIPPDKSCKDITRLCFLSHHPDAFLNKDAPTFDVYKTPAMQVETDDEKTKMAREDISLSLSYAADLFKQLRYLTDRKETYKKDNRNNYIHLLACHCNRYGMSLTDTLSNCLLNFDLPHSETESVIRGVYRRHLKEFATASFVEDNPELRPDESSDPKDALSLPTLPQTIFPTLPVFLQRVLAYCDSTSERDIMLLGAMVVASACFDNMVGIYNKRKVHSNLYLFITAAASAGKGKLIHCRQLVEPIHKAKREESAHLKQIYHSAMVEYNQSKRNDGTNERPVMPAEKMLIIPANNSSTGFFQLLNDNGGCGLLFETEGDTLAQAFNNDYSNYSDGFRKAFHHEPISYYRRTGSENVEIPFPRLSTLLSGTPGQIPSLIPSAENGLFSRFMFYRMETDTKWKNVFDTRCKDGLDGYFDGLGLELKTLYDNFKRIGEITFTLTEDQQNRFNEFFTEVNDDAIEENGIGYIATVRRSGLTAFRIMMLLTALRTMQTGDCSKQIICDDQDFINALQIISVLVEHAASVYAGLPKDIRQTMTKGRKMQFFNQLPVNFNRQDYLVISRLMKISDKTAEGYVTTFLKTRQLFKTGHNSYTKLSSDELKK